VREFAEKTSSGFDYGDRAAIMTFTSHMEDAENGRDRLCHTACFRPTMSRTPATFMDFEKNRSRI
jgi:hypothetical protein